MKNPKNKENISSPYSLYIKPKDWKPLMSPKDVKPIKKSTNNKLKVSEKKDLIAGIYWDKNSAAKKVIFDFYKNDPKGFMEDMRLYRDRGFDLEDIMNEILEGA